MLSRILQVDTKIVLSFSPILLSLSFPLCRDASQPQNSTEIPLHFQPQKGSQGADWILAGGGPRDASEGGRGEWGPQRGSRGPLDLGGLKDGGPQEETFTDEMGLGLLWAWSWVGKSYSTWASASSPMWGSPDPAGAGWKRPSLGQVPHRLSGAIRKMGQAPGPAPPRLCPGGTALQGQAGRSLSGDRFFLDIHTSFGDWRWQVGLSGCLDSSAHILSPPDSLSPKYRSWQGKESPVILSHIGAGGRVGREHRRMGRTS